MTDRTFVAQFTEFLQGKTLTHKEIAGCLGVDKGTISKWTAPHSAIKPRRENIVGLRNCGFSTDEVNQLLLAARYAPLSSQETIFPTGRADIDRYLRRVRERQAILDMSIFQEGQERDFSVVSLEAFYVPLRLAGRPPADEADRSRLRPERQPEAGAELQSNRLLAPDKRPGRHLALVGDAGSGKTTVLRHLAGALARAWLEKDPALAGRQTGLSGDLLLPLFIPLRYYHHFCDVAGPKWAISRGSFLDFLPAYFYDRYGLDLDKTFYRQLLLSGRCLLALDGFDEVPDPGARRQVLEVIRDLADDAEVGRNTIILSSRVAAYGGATQLGGRFQTLWLQNLNREERTRQVKKWVAGITPHTERPLKASDILDRMPEGSSLDQLAVTPMIVTALCVVYFYEHELPEQRA